MRNLFIKNIFLAFLCFVAALKAAPPPQPDKNTQQQDDWEIPSDDEIARSKKHVKATTRIEQMQAARAYLKKLPDTEPILGEDPEKQVSFATGTSFQFTKQSIQHLNSEHFKKTGAESPQAATRRNLGTLRLLALTWLGLLQNTNFENKKPNEKEKKADKELMHFIPASTKGKTNEEKLLSYLATPDNCTKVVDKIKADMGLVRQSSPKLQTPHTPRTMRRHLEGAQNKTSS